jgi:predicted small metal-binding protein
MAKLVCKDYGFECDFVVEGTAVSNVLEQFAKHTSEEHGIEYSKESLMHFILRKS